MSAQASYLIIAGAALWALLALAALAGVAAIYNRMEARLRETHGPAPATGPEEGTAEAPEPDRSASAPVPAEPTPPELDWEEGWRVAAARARGARSRGESEQADTDEGT
ncbi:MAG: hypothetical protein QME94_17505 [Anaerolineae bacterium]|nr:hypothetical protein [Anaerolineae bacterium]